MDNCPSEARECLSLVQSDENQGARTISARPCFASGTKFLVEFHGQTKFFRATKVDAFLKSGESPFSVIPAKAGSRGDGFDDFLRDHQRLFLVCFSVFQL
jgi:hypothetical protein